MDLRRLAALTGALAINGLALVAWRGAAQHAGLPEVAPLSVRLIEPQRRVPEAAQGIAQQSAREAAARPARAPAEAADPADPAAKAAAAVVGSGPAPAAIPMPAATPAPRTLPQREQRAPGPQKPARSRDEAAAEPTAGGVRRSKPDAAAARTTRQEASKPTGRTPTPAAEPAPVAASPAASPAVASTSRVAPPDVPPATATTAAPAATAAPAPRPRVSQLAAPPAPASAIASGTASAPASATPSAPAAPAAPAVPPPAPDTSAAAAATASAAAPATGSADKPVAAAPAGPRRIGPRIDATWAGNAPPPYPASARRMGAQGEVRLDVHVGADGRVLDVRLRSSSGSSILDRSAIDTVRKWRFKPATVDGQGVAAWYHDWKWVFRLEG